MVGSDEWDFYPARVDHKPASIFLDMGIAKTAPIASHGTMGYLSVKMQQPREDGLSSQAEFQTLAALEDVVPPQIETAGHAIYVGRNTSGGNRDFFFYGMDGASFEAAATAAMAAFSDYAFDVGSRHDPTWWTYFEFLYPSPEQFQSIKNRHVRDALAKHGDNGDKPRPIDHLAIFPEKSGCDAYIDLIRSRGFTISVGHPSNDPETGWHVEFSRVDVPNEIDPAVLDLVAGAKEHGGDYDGWGCEVVT